MLQVGCGLENDLRLLAKSGVAGLHSVADHRLAALEHIIHFLTELCLEQMNDAMYHSLSILNLTKEICCGPGCLHCPTGCAFGPSRAYKVG